MRVHPKLWVLRIMYTYIDIDIYMHSHCVLRRRPIWCVGPRTSYPWGRWRGARRRPGTGAPLRWAWH